MPTKFTVEQLISHLYNNLDYKKHISYTNTNENDHLEHIELLLDSNLVAPEDGELQKFVLDPKL